MRNARNLLLRVRGDSDIRTNRDVCVHLAKRARALAFFAKEPVRIIANGDSRLNEKPHHRHRRRAGSIPNRTFRRANFLQRVRHTRELGHYHRRLRIFSCINHEKH